ncbi:MAG: cell division protein FtsL [Candidatus Aquirickettsiella sp.]
MNMAARALTQNSLTWERGQSWIISLKMLGLVLLTLAVLSSALSVIYIKTMQRNLYSQLQASQQDYDGLKTEWSQLLLEENTWVAPVRIQSLAQQELGMRIPEMKNTVLLTKSV